MKNLTLVKLYNLASIAPDLIDILLQAQKDPMTASGLKQSLYCHGHAEIQIRVYNEATEETLTSHTSWSSTDDINADISIYQEWDYIYPHNALNSQTLPGAAGPHLGRLYRHSCLDIMTLDDDGQAYASPSARHPMSIWHSIRWNKVPKNAKALKERQHCLQLFNLLDTQYADLIPQADGTPLVPLTQILNGLYITYNPNTPHLQGLAILRP